jgi:hypothetical protein
VSPRHSSEVFIGPILLIPLRRQQQRTRPRRAFRSRFDRVILPILPKFLSISILTPSLSHGFRSCTVSRRHQNAKYRQKSAIFRPKSQFALKSAYPGCRGDTLIDQITAKICPKTQHWRSNGRINGTSCAPSRGTETWDKMAQLPTIATSRRLLMLCCCDLKESNRKKPQQEFGGEGRNRAPLAADDRIIVPYFMGDSSGLCHYWNFRFPLDLLAILLAISDRLLIGLSG